MTEYYNKKVYKTYLEFRKRMEDERGEQGNQTVAALLTLAVVITERPPHTVEAEFVQV